MTDYDGWDDEDEGQDPGHNPNLLKDLRKQLSALSKKTKEQEEELGTYRAKARQETIAEALKAAGVNEKVAKLVPADVNPDGVADWLKEYGEIFGAKAPETETAPPAQAAQAAPQELAEAAARQMKQMQDVAATGSVAGAEGRVTTDALAGAGSMEELLAMIQRGVAQGQ